MSDKIPVILDTDIGSDIDDAVCLAYLLRQSRCDLLGITTVTGDTAQRASLAALICDAAGRGDIPIHRGSPGPLMNGPGQPNVPQYEAIRERPHRTDFDPYTAVSYLQRTIRERPNEITLLAIGPMTNLALLFSMDPEIPGLLKELVLMCGVFTSGAGHGPAAREWNAMVDPVATSMTYSSRPPRFTSIGLDVTTKCVLNADECRERFHKAGGALDIVAEMAEVWFRGRKAITFHDPLASAVIFEPDLCGYADGEVTVHPSGHGISGLTAFNARSKEKPHRVATTVDSAAFFTHYFDVVGG